MIHPNLILVAEDDAALRDSICSLLEAMNYITSAASNASEALATMQAIRPDVVLTDVYMPGGDGLELLKAARERFPRIPIICMSGPRVGDYDALKMAKHLGAVASISKPFTPEELASAIECALYWAPDLSDQNSAAGS